MGFLDGNVLVNSSQHSLQFVVLMKKIFDFFSKKDQFVCSYDPGSHHNYAVHDHTMQPCRAATYHIEVIMDKHSLINPRISEDL